MAKIQRGPDEKGKFVTHNVEASISIFDESRDQSKDYKLTDLETELTEYAQVDIATATVVPTETDYYVPRFEDEVAVTVNDEDIYTGYVGDVKEDENGTFELKLFNAIRKLKTTAIDIGTEEEFVLGSDMLTNTILPKVGIPEDKIDIQLDTYIPIPLAHKSIKSEASQDIPVNFEESQAPAIRLVNKIAEATNSLWYVDGSGVFHFGDPDTEIYELSYVLETSVGKTTPPYQSVKVVGGAAASDQNWNEAPLLPIDPTVVFRSIKNVAVAQDREVIKKEEGNEFDPEEDLNSQQLDVFEVLLGELIPPTFVYKDKAIQSKKQAKAIANAVIDKLIKQTQQGWVEIVGWAPLTVFDVIQMPDFMGGESYLVQGIEHNVTSDGFTTKIHCGGLVDDGLATRNRDGDGT